MKGGFQDLRKEEAGLEQPLGDREPILTTNNNNNKR